MANAHPAHNAALVPSEKEVQATMIRLFGRRDSLKAPDGVHLNFDAPEEQELCSTMEYRPLGDSGYEIRLLRIAQPNDVRECIEDGCRTASALANWHLEHNELRNYRPDSNTASADNRRDKASSAPFVALSYTWGEENDLDQIVIDGFNVIVRGNLRKALLALRATSFVKDGGRVWVDALCIDQGNKAEVNNCVKCMKDIYRQAANVVVWLGEAANGSDEVIDLINAISASRDLGSESLLECLREAFAIYGTTIWDSLSNFIMRDYWSRLWIIQELALGGEDSTIICGRKMTTWKKLYKVYESFHLFKTNYSDPHLASIVRQELQSGAKTTYDAYQNVRLWQWEKCDDFQDLLDTVKQGLQLNRRHLLYRCRLGQCLKPVDKVYGILSLLEPAIAERIIPNHDLSIQGLYTEFAKAWIYVEGGNGDLGFLTQCGESGEECANSDFRDESLPSWVPDLRKQIRLQVNNFQHEYNSHNGLAASFTFVRDESVLSVQGVLFDKIDGLSGTRHWDDDWDNVSDFKNAKNCANAYGHSGGFREALWRTLVGDRDRRGFEADASHECILDSAIFGEECAPPNPCPSTGDTDESLKWNIHLWLKRNALFTLGGGTLQSYYRDSGALNSRDERYYRCLGRMTNWMWSRKLAVTEKGYVGVMPRVAQTGDVVALILGCSCPLLLRSSGDTFRIVAECYVQGVMQGEVFQQLEQGSRHIENILIS